MHNACGVPVQRIALDHLDLKVQKVVNLLMWMLRNKPRTSARAVRTLNSSPASVLYIFKYLELHVSEGAGEVCGWLAKKKKMCA